MGLEGHTDRVTSIAFDKNLLDFRAGQNKQVAAVDSKIEKLAADNAELKVLLFQLLANNAEAKAPAVVVEKTTIFF